MGSVCSTGFAPTQEFACEIATNCALIKKSSLCVGREKGASERARALRRGVEQLTLERLASKRRNVTQKYANHRIPERTKHFVYFQLSVCISSFEIGPLFVRNQTTRLATGGGFGHHGGDLRPPLLVRPLWG